MHISDGVLSAPVLAAGWAITVVFIAIAIWWSKKKGIEVVVTGSIVAFLVKVKPELIGSFGGDGK